MKLHEFMESSARKTPDAIAINYSDQVMTYGDLDLWSTRLAVKLQELGIGPGYRVALWAEKSPWIVVSMHAILKVGAAYVPLDPMCPSERARMILTDCNIQGIITTRERSLNTLTGPLASLPCFLFDGDGPLGVRTIVSQVTKPLAPVELSENSLAYILYTSGSTGTPKGVCISHRNAIAFVEWAASILNVQSNDRFSNHAPFHFDLTVLDLYVPLLKGASIYIIPELLAYAPKKLVDFFRQKKITHWYSVPSVLILMLERGGLLDQPADFLKALIFAGEAFPIKPLKKLRAFLPSTQFLNLYGPTETNVCTYYEVGEIPEQQETPLPIGKVCCGDEAWMVDEEGRRIDAPNTPGELIIQGPTVMLGYWGKPPVENSTYRTGDIVTRSEDGNYLFIGRKDHQIKLRGNRVSLTEIEVVLVKSEDIAEAAVFALGSGLDARLFACLVTRNGKALTLLDIKKHCSKYLPPYMNLDGFELFSDFPRTSTGKTDRKTLFSQIQRKIPHENT